MSKQNIEICSLGSSCRLMGWLVILKYLVELPRKGGHIWLPILLALKVYIFSFVASITFDLDWFVQTSSVKTISMIIKYSWRDILSYHICVYSNLSLPYSKLWIIKCIKLQRWDVEKNFLI